MLARYRYSTTTGETRGHKMDNETVQLFFAALAELGDQYGEPFMQAMLDTAKAAEARDATREEWITAIDNAAERWVCDHDRNRWAEGMERRERAAVAAWN